MRLSDGVTQEAKPAGDWMCRSKTVGRLGRQIRPVNSESRKDVESSDKADRLRPSCQEKLLASYAANRIKTDTGGMVEDTKARERTLVKELGNLTP